MKLIKLLTVGCVLCSSHVYARTDCPVETVAHIQIEGEVVLYKQKGAPWRKLGSLNDAGVKGRYSALLAAQMSGKKVLVGYWSDSYNCSEDNYSTSAALVRTYNS